MPDETSNTGATSGRQYETAVPKTEILEKGGYSPPARIYDLSNLPNAPMDPPAVTNVPAPPSASTAGDQPQASVNE
jgi:hypothetical protein